MAVLSLLWTLGTMPPGTTALKLKKIITNLSKIMLYDCIGIKTNPNWIISLSFLQILREMKTLSGAPESIVALGAMLTVSTG